jgi:hypothetical protein
VLATSSWIGWDGKKRLSRAIAPLHGEYRGASGMSVSLDLPFPGTESFRQSSAVFPAWKQGSLLFIYSSKIVKRNFLLRLYVGANKVSKRGYITRHVVLVFSSCPSVRFSIASIYVIFTP